MTDEDETTRAEDLLTGTAVKVVLLRHSGSQIAPMLGATPIDLTADELSSDLVAELIDSSATLAAPAGVPVEIVRALRLEPVPAVFTRTPLLREHRVLTFTDTGVPVGWHTLRYHKEFGVYADEDV